MNPENIKLLESTNSTNDVAMEWARNGAPHGAGIVASQQLSGRGRHGRVWFSPAGKCLYCSIVVRPKIELTDYPKLTIMAGLAVAEYLEVTHDLSIGLKWPNDVFIKGRKCGGILCESSIHITNEDSFGVIGIGLNISLTESELPEELKGVATSLAIAGVDCKEARYYYSGIRHRLLEVIEEFEGVGFRSILSRWKTRDILYGKRATWMKSSGVVVYGTCFGPDENGLLQVIDDEGVGHEVVSGDITLGDQARNNKSSKG